MQILFRCIKKAETSNKYLWLLNRLMNFAVPFNKPHGFSVTTISPTLVQTIAPYKKKNFNHVRGIHACAIATVGELAAGLLLMYHFKPSDYRVIMSHIEIDYHYQAKKNITASARISNAEIQAIIQILSTEAKTSQTITSIIKDQDNQSIATVKTTWQLKKWDAVKTKR